MLAGMLILRFWAQALAIAHTCERIKFVQLSCCGAATWQPAFGQRQLAWLYRHRNGGRDSGLPVVPEYDPEPRELRYQTVKCAAKPVNVRRGPPKNFWHGMLIHD